MTPRLKTTIEVIIGLVIIAGGGWWLAKRPAPVVQPSPTPNPLVYQNDQYGFRLTMLSSWEGYFMTEENWEGDRVNDESDNHPGGFLKGPEIHIHHPGDPQQTDNANNPDDWQDIPIMVFTHEQWDMVQKVQLTVSAAPFPPWELGRNDQYVFALPPRWVGFTDAKGQDEAQEIVKTFEVIGDTLLDTSNWKTYSSPYLKLSFSYPATPVFSISSTKITLNYAVASTYPAISLKHTIPVPEDCPRGEGCSDVTQNPEIKITTIDKSYAQLAADFNKFYGGLVEKKTIGNHTGLFIEEGVEGTGEYEFLFPVNDAKSAFVTGNYVDERELPDYRGVKDWIPYSQQKQLFEKVVSTIQFAN